LHFLGQPNTFLATGLRGLSAAPGGAERLGARRR
jgi:hypothetical protein